MTLQFNPGAYESAFQYGQNRNDQRQQMLAQALQSIPQGIQGIAAYQQQQKQDRMNQLMTALKLKEQGIDPSGATNWLATGKMPNQDQTMMAGNTTPTSSQPPILASAGFSDTGNDMMMGSPIVAAHKQHLQRQTPQSPQGIGSLLQTPNVDVGDVMNRMAKGDYSGWQSASPYLQQKIQADPRYKQMVKQQEEGVVPINHVTTLMPELKSRQDELNAQYPGGIPKSEMSYLSSAVKLNQTRGEKEDQFYQKEWDRIEKEANPLTASGRTGLGMAARADYNANRALVTLSKPMVTNQEAANVMADIAQIYQGGSATQYGMSHQGYDSLYQKVMGATQYLTGKPQDSVPEPIKQRLLAVLNEMKNTNRSVFKQQLDHIERTQPKVINKYRDEWKNLRANYEGGIAGGPNSGGQQIPTVNSQQDYDALPPGSEYVDSTGKHARKR